MNFKFFKKLLALAILLLFTAPLTFAMNVQEVAQLDDKEQFIDVLLLADPLKESIYEYLDRGKLLTFNNDDNDLIGVAVVTNEGKEIYEIINISICTEYQKKGYGKQFIQQILEHYKDKCKAMLIGTVEGSFRVPFYEKLGFKKFDIIENFYINYGYNECDEDGTVWKNMVRLIYKYSQQEANLDEVF